MPDPKVVVPYKPFVMQEGMTLKDVNNAPNLSAEAKKHIAIFDADGNGTFSKREADVFNATSIKTRVWGTSLNTVYKNGEVKSATIQGDVASLKYAPEGEIKPTEVPVENVVKNDKKEVDTVRKEIIYNEKGNVEEEKHYSQNGALLYSMEDKNSKKTEKYYQEDGKPISEKTIVWPSGNTELEKKYSTDGILVYLMEDKNGKKTEKHYQEDGKPISEKTIRWIDKKVVSEKRFTEDGVLEYSFELNE